MIVSKWNDKRLRLGWTIKGKNGQLGTITWISNGCIMYKRKELNNENPTVNQTLATPALQHQTPANTPYPTQSI